MKIVVKMRDILVYHYYNSSIILSTVANATRTRIIFVAIIMNSTIVKKTSSQYTFFTVIVVKYNIHSTESVSKPEYTLLIFFIRG
jgi:hypothetical protein